MNYYQYFESPLGRITLASDGAGLTGLWFERQRYYGKGLLPDASGCELAVFTEARLWLNNYFRGFKPEFHPSLSLRGTEFQMDVWQVLLSIPYGQTMTYGNIAETLQVSYGYPKVSAQAVGGAVGRNPVSIIVPCHRVVAKSGSLSGYAGGMEKKLLLLQLEKVDCSRFYIP